MPDFILQDNQSVVIAVNLVDPAGNIVQGSQADPGSVTATVSNPDVLSAVASADGGQVTVTALGPEATDVTVTVAGTLGGVALVDAEIAIDVDNSPAVAIQLVPGTPYTTPPAA